MTKKLTGLKMQRYFSNGLNNPFDCVKWQTIEVAIKDEHGSAIFNLNNVEVPAQFSPISSQILVSKYFRMTGIPLETVKIEEVNVHGQPVPEWLRRSEPIPCKKDDNCERWMSKDQQIALYGRTTSSQITHEVSARQVFHRVAGFWTYWGWMKGYFATEEDAKIFYDECIVMLATQRAAPNTPQWFNAGINWAYGIKGPSRGYWKASIEDGVIKSWQTEDQYTYPGLHACFIMSVDDQMFGTEEQPGIFKHLCNETRAFITGGGSGANYSKIRSKGEKLSTGATATGLKSFLEIFDRSAGIIKSGSSSRRAAKMIVVDLDHPEVEEVVDWKLKEEKKAEALIQAGYSAAWEGEAYRTISGQNGNVSVMVPTAFLTAVENDGDWDLVSRVGGKIIRKVKARELWAKISNAAVKCGDPGVQFEDIINDWDTCPNDGPIKASNPCLRGDSWIETDRGLRRIDELAAIGYANLATMIDEQPQYVFSKVFSTGRKPIVRITTNFGSFIEVTSDHLIKTTSGYIKACDLVAGSELVKVDMHSSTSIAPLTDMNSHLDFMQFAGIVLGDGWVANNWKHAKYEVGACFGKFDDDLLDKSKMLLARNGLKHKIRLQRGSVGESPRYLRVNRKFVHEWLKGSLGYVGHNACTKRIPTRIMSATRDEKLAFLAGYLCADGHVAVRPGKDINIRWAMKSEYLANDLWNLLDSLNIQAKLYPRHKKPSVFNYTDINGVAQEYSGDGKLWEVVVNGQSLRELKRQLPQLWSGRKQGLLNSIPEEYDNFGGDKKLCVQSVNDTGIEDEVYDATVPESHCFVANGMLVHNCSEYLFKDDTACNLASLNCNMFFDEIGKKFAVEDWKHAVRLLTVALDITVDSGQLPTKPLAEGTIRYRTIGIGHTGIAGVLMKSGVPYNSVQACALAAGITSLMTSESYLMSSQLAQAVAPFPKYADNAVAMRAVLRNHALAASGNAHKADYDGLSIKPYEIKHRLLPKNLADSINGSWEAAIASGDLHGYRNAFVSVIQPSGTVGLLMGCDTTAIEPDFCIVKYKTLSGGGAMKIVNGSITQALTNLGYDKQQSDEILDYVLGRNTLVGAPFINEEFLRDAGLTIDDITKIESRLSSCNSLRTAINAASLCSESLKSIGLTAKEAKNCNIFKRLGISQEEYAAADKWICGNGAFEGAPHLKDEHLPVFDTSNPSGWGTRCLSTDARLNMLAAVQPFISGGISCTFNLPSGTTAETVSGCYKKAHDLGIKCVAIYVDGSKKSQPLNRPSEMKWWDDDLPMQPMLLRGQRKKPPHTQDGFMVRVAINGDGRIWKTWVHFYEDESGQPCEVWVDISNENEFYRVAMEMWGRAVSNSLQYGQPLEELASSYIGSTGGPSGTTDHPNITYCTSVPDLIFKLMLMHYRGETQWCKRKPRPDELRMNCSKSVRPIDKDKQPPQVGSGVSGVFVEKHNVLKCPTCGASGGDSIQMHPCALCLRCGTSLGGCSP